MTSSPLSNGMSHNALASGTTFLSRCGNVSKLCTRPESNPEIYRGIRRAVVSRFPYLIFYIVRPKRVAVLAVLHHARNPAIWPRR